MNHVYAWMYTIILGTCFCITLSSSASDTEIEMRMRIQQLTTDNYNTLPHSAGTTTQNRYQCHPAAYHTLACLGTSALASLGTAGTIFFISLTVADSHEQMTLWNSFVPFGAFFGFGIGATWYVLYKTRGNNG